MKMLVTFRKVKDGMFKIPGVEGDYNLIIIPFQGAICSEEGYTDEEEDEMEEKGIPIYTFVKANISNKEERIITPDERYMDNPDEFGSRIGDTYFFAKNMNEGDELDPEDALPYLFLMFPADMNSLYFTLTSFMLSISFENDCILYTYKNPVGEVKTRTASYEILGKMLSEGSGGEPLDKKAVIQFLRVLYTRDLSEEELGMRTFSMPTETSVKRFKPRVESLASVYQKYLSIKDSEKSIEDEDIIE